MWCDEMWCKSRTFAIECRSELKNCFKDCLHKSITKDKNITNFSKVEHLQWKVNQKGFRGKKAGMWMDGYNSHFEDWLQQSNSNYWKLINQEGERGREIQKTVWQAYVGLKENFY